METEVEIGHPFRKLRQVVAETDKVSLWAAMASWIPNELACRIQI